MHPLEDPGAFLNELVESRWELIARQAWQQYQDRGRGVVVFQISHPGAEEEQPLRYLTFSGDPEEIEQSSMSAMYRLVREYEPREQAVVAAELPNGHTVFDVFAREPDPAGAQD